MSTMTRALTLPATRRRVSIVWARWRDSIAAAALLLAASALFAVLRGAADDTGIHWQRENVLRAERVLGLGQTPTQRLQDWFYTGHSGVLDWFSVIAHGSWFFVPGLLTAYILLGRRELVWRYATLRIAISYAALIAFFLLPTEPPWMALHVERVVSFTRDPVSLDNNPVAALPSLHVALPAAQAFWLRSTGMRRLSLAFGAYALLIGFAVVYSGEHYAVDVIAGIALAYAVVAAAARLSHRAAG